MTSRMAGGRFVVAGGIIGALAAPCQAQAAAPARETPSQAPTAEASIGGIEGDAPCGQRCPSSPDVTNSSAPPSPRLPEPAATCPQTEDFRARLQQQLNAAANTTTTPWVEVEFRSVPDGRVSGQVRLIPDADSAFQRQVVGQACDEVMQALAFSFELYLDEKMQPTPGADACSSSSPTAKTEQAPTPPVGSSAWPGPDIDPFTLPRAGYQADPSPRPRIPEGLPRGTAQGVVSVGVGVLPGASLGLAMTFRSRLEGASFVAFGLHQHVGAPEALNEEVFGFSSTAISVAFGRLLDAKKGFRVAALAGPRVNMVHVSWFDAEPRWSHHFGLALCGTLELALHPEAGWSTGLRGEWMFNVVRTHLVAETGADLWLQPWVSAELGWFLAADFW